MGRHRQAWELEAIIDSTRDPLLRHFCMLKHPSYSLPKGLLPRLGLKACNSSRPWGFSLIVQRLLGLVLQLMGWEPSSNGGAWQLLQAKVQQEQELVAAAGEAAAAAAAAAKCWLPSRSAIHKLGCSQQQGTKPNLPGSRGYIQVPTVRGPGRQGPKRTLYAHQIMCWAVHGPPPAADEGGGAGLMMVRHLCGKPGCIRPGCMAWGTHQQNAQDMAAHWQRAKLKGVCRQHRKQ